MIHHNKTHPGKNDAAHLRQYRNLAASRPRTDLADRLSGRFGHTLFEYQVAAVKIAAHHLNQRGGVLIGDVVGLGKTLMATALAWIFQDDHFTETLILCPRNLVRM